MKRIFVLFITVLFLASCSSQENMNGILLVERISEYDEQFDADESLLFTEGNVQTLFFTYGSENGFIMESRTDTQGNTEKINLACTCTDKIDLFFQCAGTLILVYAPGEDVKKISDELFRNKLLNGDLLYYETRWYVYSVRLSKECLYFSIENKKLSPQSDVDLSLKQNDIVDFKNHGQ